MEKYSYQIIELDLTGGFTDYEIDIEGQVLAYLTGITDLTIRLDDRSNHALPFKSKDSIELPQDISFKSLFITAAAYAETIQLMVAKPSGIQVKSQKFDLENISGQIADLRNDEVLRSALTTLTGATFANYTGIATTTIVAAVTNTNGIIIRYAGVYAHTNAITQVRLSVTAYTNILIAVNTTTEGDSQIIKDILVPAGLALVYEGDAANCRAWLAYEIL